MPDVAETQFEIPALLGKHAKLKPGNRRLRRDRRGSMMVEFAIVGPVFFFLLLFVFEIAYDQFLQEVLESSLAATARQMQIGTAQLQTNSSNLTTPPTFMSQYFCPNTFGFLNCNNLFVRVETLSTNFTNSCTDVYQATTGTLPVSGNTLELGSFSSKNGNGAGTAISTSSCDTNTGQGYCSPSGNEFVLVTAIYVGPSFLNGLLPNTEIYQYNGRDVRAQFAAAAFQTENFQAASGTATSGYAGC